MVGVYHDKKLEASQRRRKYINKKNEVESLKINNIYTATYKLGNIFLHF